MAKVKKTKNLLEVCSLINWLTLKGTKKNIHLKESHEPSGGDQGFGEARRDKYLLCYLIAMVCHCKVLNVFYFIM